MFGLNRSLSALACLLARLRIKFRTFRLLTCPVATIAARQGALFRRPPPQELALMGFEAHERSRFNAKGWRTLCA